jgi:hypothetical protein
MVAIGWAGYLYSFPADWVSISLGLFTGIVLACWAIEITGNKVPPSWRRNSPGSGRR